MKHAPIHVGFFKPMQDTLFFSLTREGSNVIFRFTNSSSFLENELKEFCKQRQIRYSIEHQNIHNIHINFDELKNALRSMGMNPGTECMQSDDFKMLLTTAADELKIRDESGRKMAFVAQQEPQAATAPDCSISGR